MQVVTRIIIDKHPSLVEYKNGVRYTTDFNEHWIYFISFRRKSKRSFGPKYRKSPYRKFW